MATDHSKLCRFYFHLGFGYADILCFLAAVHDVAISIRTLTRILRSQGHFTRRSFTDLLEVAQFIEGQILSSGSQQGYRWIHLRCI